MSEPCSFTALIRMTPQGFAALMRSETPKPLAEAIAASVSDGLNGIAAFKYLKKNQALFVCLNCYYPEPLDELLRRPEAIAQSGAFSNDGPGRSTRQSVRSVFKRGQNHEGTVDKRRKGLTGAIPIAIVAVTGTCQPFKW